MSSDLSALASPLARSEKPALVSVAGSGVGLETGAVVCGAVAGIGTQADRRRRGIGRWGRLEVDSLEFLGGLFLKWTVYSIAMERDGTTLACDGMWTGFWMECV